MSYRLKTLAELTEDGYSIRHSNFGKVVIILTDTEIFATPKSDYGKPINEDEVSLIPEFLMVEEL